MNSEKMSNLAAVYLLPYTILVFSALPVISYICILHKSIKYSAKFCFKAVKSFKVLIRKKKNMSIYYFIVIIPVALDFFLYLSCHLVSLPFSLKNFLQHFWSTVLLVTTFYLKMPLFCLHFWSTVALHIEFLVSIFFFFWLQHFRYIILMFSAPTVSWWEVSHYLRPFLFMPFFCCSFHVFAL